MFDAKSRYANQPTRLVTDRRGRQVTIVDPPPPGNETLLGYHVMRQGQRLDHLAATYLDNAHGYWRLCNLNDAMHAEQLTESDELAIPDRGL